MRTTFLVAACIAALFAAGCGGDDDDAPAGRTADLVVTVWPSGPDGPAHKHRVRCPGDAACRAVSAARLRPVPGDVACTEIYGGPATARVRGTLAGKPVDARLDRTNGCEIERWRRNAALLRGR